MVQTSKDGYLSGKLEFTTDVTCTKHESDGSHSCGGHCH